MTPKHASLPGHTAIGRLTEGEIDDILRSNYLARLACVTDGKPYIVPIVYFYARGDMYGYTSDGRKLAAMRMNPEVCVQVDEIQDFVNWRSVVAWGRFEEVPPREGEDMLRHLSQRMNIEAHAKREPWQAAWTYVSRTGRYGVMYKIVLHTKTGRFESSGEERLAVRYDG